MGMSRLVSRAEKGIVNWVCWKVDRDFSYEDALWLINRADQGELWLKVVNDIAFFSINSTPIGALHCKGVLAAGEWGPNGPEEGFDAFEDYWDEYVREQERLDDIREKELFAKIFPDGAPELVCPV